MKFSYDLHTHSCLSPCGSDDMTPNNLVNMAALGGLDILAVSDHNSAKNLPAASRVAEEAGILLVPAIEACTSEEVHVLCLFASLEGALSFGEEIYRFLPPIANKPDFFGNQLILDENDERIGTEPLLLINALTIGIEKLISLTARLGGLAIPAHVNKQSNSIIANLGFIPPEYGFSCIEVNPPDDRVAFDGMRISDSDAHSLERIHEPEFYLELPERSAQAVIDCLKGSSAQVPT